MLRRSSRLVSPACAASSQPPPPPPPPAESRRPRSRSIQAAEPLAVPPAGKRPRPDLSSAAGRSHESKWWQRGCQRVAGVDEAGRGPLAGPLVAAACVLPPELHLHLPGMDDSKKLSEKEREDLYTALTTNPDVEWAVSVKEHTLIDEVNILQATLRAMEAAVAGLPVAPERVLIDGNRMPPALAHNGETVVGGDGKSFAIAAASVLAKVTRDRIMVDLDARYPQYGFKQHKGYGVAAHMAAIAKHGPCPVHRCSFQPTKGILEARADAKKSGAM